MVRAHLISSCLVAALALGLSLWSGQAAMAQSAEGQLFEGDDAAGAVIEPAAGQMESQTERRAVVLGTLDKITARVSNLEAPIDEPVRFNTLEITARACNSTPPEEPPETSAFLEVRELKRGEEPVTIFTGWMFASSPALSAMEHPVYDVWVLNCTTLAPEAEGESAKKSPSDESASASNP